MLRDCPKPATSRRAARGTRRRARAAAGGACYSPFWSMNRAGCGAAGCWRRRQIGASAGAWWWCRRRGRRQRYWNARLPLRRHSRRAQGPAGRAIGRASLRGMRTRWRRSGGLATRGRSNQAGRHAQPRPARAESPGHSAAWWACAVRDLLAFVRGLRAGQASRAVISDSVPAPPRRRRAPPARGSTTLPNDRGPGVSTTGRNSARAAGSAPPLC